MDHGLPHGSGTIRFQDQRAPFFGVARAYQGSFRRGLKQGHGTYVYSTGNRYEGAFAGDLKEGEGEQVFKDGSSVRGTFAAGAVHGHGERIFPNGAKYTGSFLHGTMHGHGTLVLADGSRYEGGYANGLREGDGVFSWPDGERYEGAYRRDLKHGEGVYTWSDGRQYRGRFDNDKRCGYGTFTWPNGDRYEGYYCNDMRSGSGTLCYADGSVDHGNWAGTRLLKICAVDADHAAPAGKLSRQTQRFHEAAAKGDIKTVREILQTGDVDINAADEEGKTALYLAAISGDELLVSFVLDQGANINQLTDSQTSVLVASYRLSKGLDVGNDECAASKPSQLTPKLARLVRYLLDRGVSPNSSAYPSPVLYTAAQLSDVVAAKLFLEFGGDANYIHNEQFTVLYQAVSVLAKRAREYEEMLAAAETNLHDTLKYHRAAKAVHMDLTKEIQVIECLLAGGADPNKKGPANDETVMHIIAAVKVAEGVRTLMMLLEHGGNPNLVHAGLTPLAIAIMHGNDAAVDLLLRHNADPNVVLGGGYNVLKLLVAAEYEHVRSVTARAELVDQLLLRGIDTCLVFPLAVIPPALGNMADCLHTDYVVESPLCSIPVAALSAEQYNTINHRVGIAKTIVAQIRVQNHQRPSAFSACSRAAHARQRCRSSARSAGARTACC